MLRVPPLGCLGRDQSGATVVEFALIAMPMCVLLMGGLLHDTLEDTDATYDDLVERFGLEVASLVAEVTDDKSLPKEERKRLQIEKTPAKSRRAKPLPAPAQPAAGAEPEPRAPAGPAGRARGAPEPAPPRGLSRLCSPPALLVLLALLLLVCGGLALEPEPLSYKPALELDAGDVLVLRGDKAQSPVTGLSGGDIVYSFVACERDDADALYASPLHDAREQLLAAAPARPILRDGSCCARRERLRRGA